MGWLLGASTQYHLRGILRCADSVGYLLGSDPAARVFQRANRKDVGESEQEGREAGRVTAGEAVLFVLFRIVHITPASDKRKGIL